ncbi:MAG TPA: prepilin-type N-terminal cleavage/methylation domain-containing protein [Phycisphaerae bacterium]|nr:prepilin-type N-terminal cleavage/methylation domain-containing protein [Phycisphaerae bacterium]HRR83679.1 prepilin-type N-terminal cleavage/methylation domain-containing protein [Phycisphaerae bacterium]
MRVLRECLELRRQFDVESRLQIRSIEEGTLMYVHCIPGRSKKAFTLIEVLVVVAIMALLMSILLPSLRNARALSRAVVCSTQLKQIFNATVMYSQTNDDRLPYFGWYEAAQSGRHWWITQLAKNLGNEYAIYKCAIDEDPARMAVVREKGVLYMSQGNEPNRFSMDITYRSACDTLEHYKLRDGTTGYRARKITSYKRPYWSILMVEANSKRDESTSECFRFKDDLQYIADPVYIRNYPFLKGFQRHLGKSNLMFADGHVERLTPKQIAAAAIKQEHYLD